jgi:hypothetical protein
MASVGRVTESRWRAATRTDFSFSAAIVDLMATGFTAGIDGAQIGSQRATQFSDRTIGCQI